MKSPSARFFGLTRANGASPAALRRRASDWRELLARPVAPLRQCAAPFKGQHWSGATNAAKVPERGLRPGKLMIRRKPVIEPALVLRVSRWELSSGSAQGVRGRRLDPTGPRTRGRSFRTRPGPNISGCCQRWRSTARDVSGIFKRGVESYRHYL